MRVDRENLEFKGSPQARKLSRRRFLTRLGWGSFTLTLGSFLSSIVSFILPKMSYEPSTVFSVGRPEDYRPGDMKLLEAKQVYIFRTPYGFQAVSAICTHLGCSYKPFGPPEPEYPIVHARCPCHGSVFARDGRVLGGPAPRPLPFYYMSLSPDGRLAVDKSIVDLSDELSLMSGEGIAHDLYLDPQTGKLVRGPLPDGSECTPCRG